MPCFCDPQFESFALTKEYLINKYSLLKGRDYLTGYLVDYTYLPYFNKSLNFNRSESRVALHYPKPKIG